MSALNITVAGIRPNNQSIGPPGNHLRWAFPSQAGFPAKGFVVYRRISGEIEATECLNLTKEKILPEQIVFSGTSLQGVVFVYPGPVRIEGTGAGLSINPPGSGILDLRFTQPVIHVSLFVRDIKSDIQLKAYVGQHVAATSTTLTSSHGSGTLSVTAPYINRVTIPLQFTSLLEVCYHRLADECRNENWGDSPIMHLPLPQTFDEAIGRLPADPFFNRYASNAGDAIQRYKPGLKQLLEWLWLLQNPTSAQFSNPGDLPDQLRLPSTDVQHPLQTIQPQSILLLAALDPNIARLLSLYWTDVEGAPDGPEPGMAYDYKVEGRWSSHRVGCGLVFGLGNEKAARPYVSGRLRGDQLPGLRFQGKEPLGRVGLRWPRPREGQGVVQPVLFDLSRQSGNRDVELTGALPVLVPASAWDQEDTALFIDTDVALGAHTYSLRPVDLFGQVGKWIKSGRVIVQDLEAPPPPVRLRVTTAQSGYPWLTEEQRSTPEKGNVDVDLRFEYGDAQNRQAPDAGSFQLYYRTESLFERQTVTAQIQMTTALSNGLKLYTVQISGVPGIDLSRYSGGILARQSATGTVLPADQRLRFRIAEVLASNRLKLGPTEENFPAGSYEIISDPHLRATWQPWGQPMPVRPELESPLKKVADVFQARAVLVQTLGAKPNPLSLLPASHQPDSLTQPPANVEVLLDCELLEPDLFTGGELQINGQSIPVVYSTSGPAFNGHNHGIAPRLGLPPDSPVIENTSLQLIPAETSLVRVLTLEAANLSVFQQTPGGEAAFDVLAGESGETLTYVARVMSSIQPEGASGFSVLVRLLSPTALTALESGVQQVRYYLPYRVNLRAALESEAAAPEGILPLPFTDGQSSQNLYLAITTSDLRKNESPLSAPVQVTAVKPPPKGAPGRPYPCPDAGADAGYATPPDRQGRATLCLEWGAGSLESTSGLRYEIARALDNTILTAHRRNWLLGQVEIEAPVTGGIQVEATLTHINLDTKRGLYTANLAAADLGNLAPAKFQGGRLTQNSRQFQVTAIGTGNNEDLRVVLRPMAQEAPAEGAAMLYSPPDYSGVRNDTEALRELASQNPDAFGIVTGVPIRKTGYLDEIPGIGRNRYFYRVRAVDAAENRSAWSEVSVPFYQVDTTPPEAPMLVSKIGGNRQIRLTWKDNPDPRVVAYRVYRTGDVGNGSTLSPSKLVATIDVRPPGSPTPLYRPLRISSGQIRIRPHSTPMGRPRVFRRDDLNATDLVVSASDFTHLDNHLVKKVNPLLSDGDLINVSLNLDGRKFVLSRRPGSEEPLTVSNGQVDLSFGFVPTAIKAVLYRSAYLSGKLGQPEFNLVTTNTTLIGTTISGLNEQLPDGTPVVVLVTDTAGTTRTLTRVPGQEGPLTVTDNKIHLGLDLADASLDDLLVVSEDSPAKTLSAKLDQESLIEPSSDGNMLTIRRLNPLIAEGTTITVHWSDSGGEEHTSTVAAGEHEFVDDDVRGDRQYAYRIVTVCRVALGDQKQIEIASPPGEAIRISCLDNGPPAFESLSGEWMAGPVAFTTAVRLTWSSRDRAMALVHQRQEGGQEQTIGGWLRPFSYDPDDDLFHFEAIVEADPQSAPLFRIMLQAANGRKTGLSEISLG